MSFSFSLPLIGESISSEEQNDDGSGGAGLSEKCRRSISVGANMLLAPTESITHKRLDEISRDEDFSQLVRSVTEITAGQARKNTAVGGMVSPSGTVKYSSGSFESLHFDYLEKITILKDSGADFILLKDAETLGEMRAAVLAAKTADIPIFITMTVDEEGKNKAGADYIAALITLQALGASAFGIHCSDGIEAAAELLEKAFPHAEIPLISAEAFTTCSKDTIKSLVYNGAGIFIDIYENLNREIVSEISSLTSVFDENTEKDSFAAAVDCEAFFLSDDLVLSEPIQCSYGLTDAIIDLDDENINSAYIELYSPDDAAILADNANMTRLPITVHTNDPVTLEAALRYFQGLLIIDTQCDIDDETLQQLAKKYGAILY